MITRAEHCVVACAEAWRGDGEALASPFGWIPTIGARLAKATFEPGLVVTDGEAMALANTVPVGETDVEPVVEAWLPFRFIFDLLSAGRRHVMMGAVQIDAFGNQNISCIGDHAHPRVQLIGARGGPGNTVNHATSYWIPNHSPRVFVERVDFVSGVGTDRGGLVRYVVTNLGVFDFETPERRMRVRSLHPGVNPEEVREQTGFELAVPDDVPPTRDPTDEELRLVREVLDPTGLRDTEVR
jgi:acyl CoA:acetate/3-ketoacid CoA transferase beta subunit